MPKLCCLLVMLLSVLFSMGQNTGIGTTTPSEKLEVNGAIRIGTTLNSNPGTVRFNNGNFEGRSNLGRWEFLGVPTNTLITVSDTTGLLGYGYSIYGKQIATIQPILGLVPGAWLNQVAAPAGAFLDNRTGVWTGSEILVYVNNRVYRLNPTTNTWTQSTLNTVAGFVDRFGYSAIWTGTELIIYGGYNGLTAFGNGVRYNPTTNTWTAIATAPVKRINHSAIYRSNEMIVFGGDSIGISPSCPAGGHGYSSNQVWKYNTSTNTWTGPVAVTGTIPPARREHISVWTGSEMLVFGGSRTSDGTCVGLVNRLFDTYSFNPVLNQWQQKASGSSFQFMKGAWSGSKLLIWAANMYDNNGYTMGVSFDPVTNSWSYLPNENAVKSVSNTICIWNGAGLYVVDYTGYQVFDPAAGLSNVYNFPEQRVLYILRKI